MTQAEKALATKRKAQTPSLTMTVKEAAKLLGISSERAYAASAAGQLPTIMLGKRRVVPRAALERMLKETKPETEAA